MGDHLSAQVTDLLALEAEVDDCPWTAGEIDHGPGEGLVEGCVAAAEAGEGLAGAEGLGECCAQSEKGIFGSVVVIDYSWLVCAQIGVWVVYGGHTVEIALGSHGQTPSGVLGQCVQHVV